MSLRGRFGNAILGALLLIVGGGLGAMGGVSVAMNAGWARWPGHAAEARVAVAMPAWHALSLQRGAVPLAPEAVVAAIAVDDFVQRWAEVTLRARAEQPGNLDGLDADLGNLAQLLSGTLQAPPAFRDGSAVLQVGGFRDAAAAAKAASTAGEALLGLVADIRAEELLALREGMGATPSVDTSLNVGDMAAGGVARDAGVGAAIVTPIYSRPARPLLLAGGIGGVVGLLLMFLALRPRVPRASHLSALDSISRALGVEVIGAIPQTRRSEPLDADDFAPRILDERSDIAAFEAFEVLLTNFRFAVPARPIRSVYFLSAVPGEGCAAVALNFAAAHARRGQRVGFMAMGTAIPVAALPEGLRLLDEAPGTGHGELDLLVQVGASVLADPEARSRAAQADAVVLVLDTAITGKELALRALGLLGAAQAPCVGVVLNRVRRAGLRRAFQARAANRAALDTAASLNSTQN